MHWKQTVCILCLATTLPVQAIEKIQTITIDGEDIKDISRVSLKPDGSVMIVYGASGMQVDPKKLTSDFLASWGISAESIETAKQEDFERAVQSGKFRIFEGVVYDLRKKQPGWTSFRGAKIFQTLDTGEALVDPSPDTYNFAIIHVVNLPAVSDRERFDFTAKQIGTYTYENKKGDIRVIRDYSLGRICERSQIPDAIWKEGKISAELHSKSGVQRDVLSELPQNDDLICSGTGFFITDDGYLITNDHVVRGVRRAKIRLKSRVYDAEIVKKDQDADLALLKVKGVSCFGLPVILNKEAALGDEVFTVGFPNIELQGIEPKYTKGNISSLAGINDDPSHYQISVQVQPGNSGGALFDDQGKVVGVIVSRLNDISALKSSGSIPQNVNYAIKATVLRDFLKSARDLAGKLKSPDASSFAESPIKTAQESTVIVLGYK